MMGGLVGCGPAGPKTHPIRGKVQLANADVKVLAGSHVEAVLETDTFVRASGEIQEDGGFVLQTLHKGEILDGALEGRFQVRIILNDDDAKLRRQAARAVAQRYLNARTSGVTLDVPTTNDVSITLTPQ